MAILGTDFLKVPTCWFIPRIVWVITPVISGLTPRIPFITRVVTHLLSGMILQALTDPPSYGSLLRHRTQLRSLFAVNQALAMRLQGLVEGKIFGAWTMGEIRPIETFKGGTPNHTKTIGKHPKMDGLYWKIHLFSWMKWMI